MSKKTLIIAEKPSVAADIARALGGFEKQQDYFESDEYVLSSAVGHLLELHEPEQYEVKRGKWSFAHLPVIPPHFDLRPIERSHARLKVVEKLIKRKDVAHLINACDAGREGELIFRYIVQHAGARQPILRLWLQSMTPASIRDAFSRLRTDHEMQPLADAARCRSEADWLVGINGTRAMTAFNSRDGGFFLTTVGRVQTPTLAIVVDRDDQIRKFVARDYWEVRANFACEAGIYEGRWFDPQFRRSEEDPEARAERLWNPERAQAIVDACVGQPGLVSEESKPSSQLSPLLFDLTSLQREANSRFGFSAKTTLSLAQALYERHKVLTYPRTDSRALPEDYVEVVVKTMQMLAGKASAKRRHEVVALQEVAPHARRVLDQGWVRPNKRIFDNSKISDHFAIVPTLQEPGHLSEIEQKLYDLVVRRFLAVFFPAAEYLVTTRITEVQAHQFKTDGRILVDAGWLSVYGREAQDGQTSLVPVKPQERVQTTSIEANALATRPPARYTEATLLSAMEGAGKFVDDDELRAAMAGKGLGTPATRASIIEGLISERYLVRDGRDLHPTAKAFQLLTLLRGLGVDELTAPELTGEWEYKLAQMEHGALDRATFMREIAQITGRIVERAKSYESDTVPGDYATLKTPCPKCGSTVQENYRRFACTKCDFSLPKHPASRTFEYEEVEQLLRERQIGPLTGFRSKMGRPFAAALKISPEFKLEFDFGNSDGSDDGSGQAPDFSDQTPLGPCPKCGSRVFELPMAYICEKAVGPSKTCDFRSGRVILQQAVPAEQMRKLLAQGRTDLLREFVSNRTRRKFAAYLIRKPDGTIGFEFEPRPVRAAKAGAQPPASADALAIAAASPRKRAAKTPAAIASAPAAPAKEPGAMSKRTSARDGDQPQTSPTARKAPARKVAATKAAPPKAGAVKAAIRKTAKRSVKAAVRHKS
jgi:DNA topoisomerase-3